MKPTFTKATGFSGAISPAHIVLLADAMKSSKNRNSLGSAPDIVPPGTNRGVQREVWT